MGNKLGREDAQNAMDTLTRLPSVLSVLGAFLSWIILRYVKANQQWFSARIVQRIVISVGLYSVVNCIEPDWDSNLMPVNTKTCYAQSVLLISLENLTYFWQCALAHNVYDVVVNKNLRPEEQLLKYDNYGITFSLFASLAPWVVSGYGWRWFKRCKYSLYDEGVSSQLFTDLVHCCCMGYVLFIGVRMTWNRHVEDRMNPNFRMQEARERHFRVQHKAIVLTWVWAFCRVWRLLISFANMWEYIAHQEFLEMPDDVPFYLVVIEAFATEGLGVGMFLALFAYDAGSIRTQVLNSFPLLKGWYLSLIHISEPTRLLSISYAVFCLKKKKKNTHN
eukprot:TRINITY_DN12995_c0_g1_i9.p1 TRINITY_DN12995_c0_g1~~TRINITY_DN12995_c0_g1_i9.p1  ORF type:complete len:334 (-),score=81.40 TRINITY_DN12995_c0_g1_i9:15-1016(-)